MQQWEIWLVDQIYARKELIPPQPNDPSEYNRMYVVIANPRKRATVICCPVQNKGTFVGTSEVFLPLNYEQFITKDCKIVTHNIFTLPIHFFKLKRGSLRQPEQEKVQVALALVLGI